jgi:DNA-directed RNA polymerase subunit RPC12/RpoP
MTEKTPIVCYECDSEFFIFPTHAAEDEVPEVSFCPYCGSELELLEDDDIDEEYDEDE